MHILFAIWSILTGLWLLFLALRSWRFATDIVSLSDVNESDYQAWPRVSLIVPACNEVDTIESAAKTLLTMDYPNLEIVLVNDRSTDGTREIVARLAAQDSRIQAVHIRELPAGWLGKVNALSEGIKKATGDWILLADADVHFSATALKKAIVHTRKARLDYLTVVPGIHTRTLPLRAMMAQFCHQGSVFIEPKRLNDPANSLCFGVGAFNLMRKNVYERSEQLQWIRMEVVDDSGVALMMRRAGAQVGLVAGKGEVELIWYPSVLTLIKGIEKNAFAVCQYSLSILTGFTLTTWGIVFGSTVAPFLSHSLWIESISMACTVTFLAMVYYKLKKLLSIDVWTILLFPLSMGSLPLMYWRAAILTFVRGGIQWRNVFYPLEELRANQRVRFIDMVFARTKFLSRVRQGQIHPQVKIPRPTEPAATESLLL